MTKLWITVLLLSRAVAAQDLPSYKPAQKTFGVIRNCGADNMLNLLRLWEVGFVKAQHWARYSDQLWSTAQAIPGLYTHTCDIGLMPRKTWPIEELAFHSEFGYDVSRVLVATAPIGDHPADTSQGEIIFVNKDNPLAQLTTEQLDRIFSSPRNGGWGDDMKWSTGGARSADTNIRTWDQLGLTGEWVGKSIHTYGFDLTVNGFSVDMGRRVFHGGDLWNPNYQEFVKSEPTVPGSGLVSNGQLGEIAKDRYGIAIAAGMQAAIGKPGIKPLAIALSPAGPYILPTHATYANRTYPLIEGVYLYVNRAPGKPLEPAIKEFLTYILSSEGQKAVAEDDAFLPLPAATALQERTKLE